MSVTEVGICKDGLALWILYICSTFLIKTQCMQNAVVLCVCVCVEAGRVQRLRSRRRTESFVRDREKGGKGKAEWSLLAAVHAVIVGELQGFKACAVVKQLSWVGRAKCHWEKPGDINTQIGRLWRESFNSPGILNYSKSYRLYMGCPFFFFLNDGRLKKGFDLCVKTEIN